MEASEREDDIQNLSDKLEAVSKDLADLRRYAKTSESHKSAILKIRRSILDSNCNSPIPTTNAGPHVRNEAAHGGNVSMDIEAIQSMEALDTDRTDRWKSAFRELYYFSFDEREKVSNGFTVEEVCNMHGTFKTVQPWCLDTTASNHAVSLCEFLLSEYNGKEGFWNDGLYSHYLEEVRVFYNSKLLL